MPARKSRHTLSLAKKYPPSDPCSCEICIGFCLRPGWWSVREAAGAIEAGYSLRMMLEVAPELTFGVLSPAFKGCERAYATNQFAKNGCTFLKNTGCELYGTGYQPLECRFCNHDRPGLGAQCHADLELEWNSPAGQQLVRKWIDLTGFWKRFNMDRM